MRLHRTALKFFVVLVALVLVAACSPLPATPTPVALVTMTPRPTGTLVVSTAEPGLTASPTATLQPGETPYTATATATATATGTALPADTALPTDTPPPAATATSRPSNTPPPPSVTPRQAASATATATPTTPAITDWRGEYFANRSLQAPPALVRNDRVIDFTFASGQAPVPGVPPDNWSARWTRDWSFEEGNYRFHVVVDDGARLWVDNRLIVDAWTDGSSRELAANMYLSGRVPLRLEYYNNLGEGRIRLNWERVTSYPDWQGSYFANRDLSGQPLFQRNDPAIDFNWGAGAPRADMPANDFSVRWTRRLNLDRAGSYRFQVVTDDGVRLWVDDRLIIDAWREGYAEHDVSVNLAPGGHDVRLEYFEHLGGALARLTLSFAPPAATSTSTPTQVSSPTTATPTATRTSAPPTTATPTPTRTSAPPTTATPTPTRTSAPPTATTAPPVPRPELAVSPPRVRPGQVLTIIGLSWPANARVDLFLNQAQTGVMASLGQATADGSGAFRTEVAMPRPEALDPSRPLQVMARTPDGSYQAEADLQVLGEPAEPQGTVMPRPGAGGPTSLSFRTIPTTQERFALEQPTFLVLDSAAAWSRYFGSDGPPVEPPVQWDQEYVIGVFLGQQPAGVEAGVQSVTTRGGTVVVQLSSDLPQPGIQVQGGPGQPRTLIRLLRNQIGGSRGLSTGPTFAFVDASGRLLAQGSAGQEPLGIAAGQRTAPLGQESPDMGALAVPGAESESQIAPEAMPGAAAESQIAPEAELVPAPKVAPGGEEPAEPEAGVESPALAVQGSEPGGSVAGWVVLAFWLLVVIALVVGLWLVIRRAARDEQ